MKKLLGWLGLAAMSGCGASLAASGFVVTGPMNGIVLKPGMAQQKARVFFENRSDITYSILGGTFYFGLVPTSGGGSAGAPRITKVQSAGLEGSPLAQGLMQEIHMAGSRGDYMIASVGLDRPNSMGMVTVSEVAIDAGSRWPLAEVEFDTTGIKDGPATYRLTMKAMMENGAEFDMNSFMNAPSTTDPGDILELGISEEFILVKVEAAGTDTSRSLQFRADAGMGGMVFELEGTPGITPRIEYTDELAGGRWRALDVQPTQSGTQWRWAVPIDATIPTRFYRTAVGTTGTGTGSNLPE